MPHPLDQLSADEIARAVAAIRADARCPARHAFHVMHALEPDRVAIRAFDAGESAPTRCAFAALFDLDRHRLSEIVVNLTTVAIESWADLDPRVQPGIFDVEHAAIRPLVLADERWRAAMTLRGVTDLDAVEFETGPAGRFGDPWDERRRVGRTLTFVRPPGTLNYYAHPVQGLIVVVDLETCSVLEVIDEGVVPVPTRAFELPVDVRPPTTRPRLHPIDITQPEGPGFTVDDGLVRWQNWSFRVSMHPTDGLVLHQVRYNDSGRERPILHRAAIAEMVIPYGDGSANERWRNAFDVGEDGVGQMLNGLERGCDCLGEITYLDATVAYEDGTPRTIENAICLHEEDWNVSWKHTYERYGVSTVRRSRRLVVSCWATFGNYDYGFYWYFYTEGHIQLEMKLTGIVFTGAVPPEASTHPTGTVVAPGLYAPIHQHIMCFRLDSEVDGAANSVFELDALPDPPGPDNPHGMTFRMSRTRLETESAARRDIDARRHRTWLIANEGALNATGAPTAFKLVPSLSTVMLADESSFVSSIAGFARHQLWVTAYDPAEQYPAGRYPSWGDRGLPQFAAANRNIAGTEIVVWHAFSATHLPRPEDWPVMPVESAGFTLVPWGFFDQNPALDLPLPPSHAGDGGAVG